jgi:anti-anti-sigma factor
MSLSGNGACLEALAAGCGTVTLSFSCPALRYPEVDRIGEELHGLIERLRPRTLLLDFKDVQYLAAGALGQLLVLHGRMQDRGGRLVLSNLSSRLRELLHVTRLQTIFEVVEAE